MGSGFAVLVLPVITLSQGDNGDPRQDNGFMERGGYLHGSLNTKVSVAIIVSNGNKCFEPGLLGNEDLLLQDKIFKTSSLMDATGKESMTSDFFMGREKR